MFRALTPFAVAILAWLVLRENITSSALVAMIVSFKGVVILSVAQPDEEENTKLAYQPFSYTTGIMFAFGAVVSCAVLCITTRGMQKV